ncbi:thioredoxin family protein [Dyadobacter sp. CY356]|uniref:thioredoxin family protein n=1 Tax=Dyadobacter sp. CY356 TaxID=2906442 RepID=UPI001F2BA99F|nr:thioredoxin family protein [Dyadobacter sp. CY356]MCF0056236.1 thioredoxin family protein [Dyadobacter sp. CY356]
MKSLFTLLVLLIIGPISYGQIVFLNNPDWEQAAKKARSEKKLIFIHLESNNCQQCNEVATQGFNETILKEKFEKHYVSIRVNTDTEMGHRLAEKFEIKGAPVSLFVDADGNILNRFNGSTSAGFMYAQQADIALGRRGEKKVKDFEKEYNSGSRSSKFLKEYIAKRKEMQLPTDDLLEEYVGQLPVDSLKNYNVIKFIYMQGPSLDSRGYKMIQYTERKLIDSLYKSIPVQEAVAINNAIIETTFRNAVRNKNINLAHDLSRFIQNTYRPDFAKGSLASQRSLLRYFYAVKDTVQYIQLAENFLDYTHMRLTVDSLKRMDEKEMKIQQSRQIPGKLSHTMRISPPSQYFHIELNEHAWHFFEMAKKKGDLENALKWSQQSMLFFDALNKDRQGSMSLGNPAYLDTYAQILYKLGRKDEAIEWQTKAVSAQKVTGMPSGSFEATLNKMKARE